MMHDEIRELLDRVYAAWGDADAFAALYRPDATVVMPGVFRQGRDAVRESMGAAWAGPLKDSRPIDEPLDIRVIGDSAVVVSRSGILLSGQTELAAGAAVTATWVLTRSPDEGWAVAAYTNTPAPA